jgi:transposase
VWAVLEDDFELLLVDARHVKDLPGRKTDVKDAEWLCQLLEAGLLRASFVPPKPIRALRQLTRYRKAQIKERQREANRLHKALEDTGIKLDCVATNILGKSGRAMLDALYQGTTDPEILADLAQGKLRKKLPALKQALEGRFEPLHALLVSSILAHLDFLDEQIERLSDAIEEQLRPFAPAVELLRSLDVIETRTAQNILAEIGVDMSVFPTAGHLASWGGQCPGNDQSAGKRRSGRTRKGSICCAQHMSPLPWRIRTAPRSGSRSVSLSASASLIRSPARQSMTITPRNRSPSEASPAARITAMISSTVGGSGGYRRSLLRGGRPWWKLEVVAGERRRPARSSISRASMTSSCGRRLTPPSSWPSSRPAGANPVKSPTGQCSRDGAHGFHASGPLQTSPKRSLANGWRG